ncbi:BTAD domain-containing putative transcriptional regulator [Nocardioides sp. HM23]|uniref:nSTAND1 domain-containing NTPase n=1 Tax=Nocardioides bizhenqiangii TaxID=3095076 RepID=UPI002ACAE5AB|nr:BTAD domain-containing putative transcriptional regulator [Nocardioides sp. HM23]MDZ5619315.1 BTAD domain-containing putative transcriptional regulator [Nocardioides sp. HM23]
MGIAVLGPLTVDGSGRLGPRDRVVLQALAIRLGQPVSADELIDAVWRDHPPASAAKNLQSCVVRLRKALGAQAIETTADGYRLIVPADEIDARRFESQVARARHLLELGETDRVAFLLEQALDLWRGAAFVDLAEWSPGRGEAGRLEELRQDAEELLLDAQLRRGRAPEALPRAHEMVRSAPLRERRWELLALAQYRSGAQGEALRTIRRLRAVLARELGIDPSPEVVALEQSILRQDPALVVPDPSPVTDRCPWQGLMAYDVDDAERFFGRDADVTACLAILGRTSFVALVGPSGSGKSSIMRAGVLAALRSRGHRVVLITPGSRPTQALSALPENAPPGTVLAVDQAEEVFALCEDLGERRAFLQRLADEARRRPVLVTMRGDRLSQVTEHAGFSRLVEQGLHLVGALDEAGLRDAVERPAHQAGLVIEPGLVELLVREVRDDPGALPLLSHALLETWQRREGSTLTVDGYHASGGIRGAVAQSAEQLYGQIEPDQRRQLRDLMLRLVSPGVGGEPVRAQVPRRLIASDVQHEQLIERLVDARLVTSDQGVLEITHEALARAWPRLRGWLDDDVEGQRIRHHLSAAADAWDSLGRPDSELYRGVRLTRALDWQSRTETALTESERAFLSAAQAASDAEERSAAERARAQARLIRRLRIVLGGAVVLLVLALVAGILAAIQSDRANENAAQAEQLAVSADARRIGARAQLADDISLSLLLAAAGARLDNSPETRVNLVTALAKRPTLVRSAPPGGGYLEGFDVSRDGRWIASSDDQNRMHLYDAATNRLLRSYDAGRPAEDGQAFLYAAFSPDSRRLAVIITAGESTEPVRLLDPNTMEPTTELDFPVDNPVSGVDVQFSRDNRYLAATMHTSSVGEDGDTHSYALVWDLRSPTSPPERVWTGVDVQWMALSPNGQTLYTNWPLTAYDVASGDRLWRREDLTAWVTLDVNAAGTLLALEDFTRKDGFLVDAASGETVHRLRGHRAQVFDMRFSGDGLLVGSVSQDGDLIVWDTATGRPLERWDTFDPWGVGFSPDNDLVYGGGGDSMLRTWDRSMEDTYLQQTTQVGDSELFAQADISPDGQQMAYRWLDDQDTGWVRFVDTRTGEATPATRLPVNESPWVLGTWHPQGGQYAAYCEAEQCAKGVVSVLDSVTGKPLRKPRDIVDGDASIWTLAYVDGGRSLLVGDTDGRTLIVDAETLRPRGERFNIPTHAVTPIGDGSTVMVYEAAGDGLSAHWRVIDLSTGAVQSEGDMDLAPYASVASPDGSTVAVASSTGEIVTIDVASGEQRRSTGLGAAVFWLNYSDDGEMLVSGAEDGGVSLWDSTTLELLGTVYPPRRGDAVPAAAQFIGDSHDVAIASYDGRVYTWETDLDRALDFACQMAGRDLTEEEWEEVLPAQPYQSVCPDE